MKWSTGQGRQALVAFVIVTGIALLVPPQGGGFAEEGESDDASVHLNFASILFYKGRRLLQTGDATAGGAVFKVIEQELQLALQLSEHDPNERRRQLLRSQSAYLLGDVNLFVFKDHEKAKAFYEEALRYFPEHDGAIEALKRFGAPTLTTQ